MSESAALRESPRHPTPSAFHTLLHRPADQRRREYQYRFAQSVVFGLPVLALQWFGRSLGGFESGRWVAILQALLTGWVLYVGAAGMLLEGLVWLGRRRLTADLLPALAVVALYAMTLARLAVYSLSPAPDAFPHTWFYASVLLIILWTGLRWWQYARRNAH